MTLQEGGGLKTEKRRSWELATTAGMQDTWEDGRQPTYQHAVSWLLSTVSTNCQTTKKKKSLVKSEYAMPVVALFKFKVHVNVHMHAILRWQTWMLIL